MTLAELAALPVSFDLVTAGRAFAIGRSKAHAWREPAISRARSGE